MSESFKQEVSIFKVLEEKQIVYGKALVPNRIDFQGDLVTIEDVEESAHNFLMNLQKAYVELLTEGSSTTNASEIGFMHKIFKGVGGFGYIVESYIDPEGSWILGTKITDQAVWKMIKEGKITGYSIGGKGVRIPLE